MNQPCYNSIALARHQHEIDRREAMDMWIDAAVDRLLDNKEFLTETAHEYYRSGADCGLDNFQKQVAFQQACSEHEDHLYALEQARIYGQEGL